MHTPPLKRALWTLSAAAAALLAGTAQAALQDRDLDGDGVTDAFYDTDLDLTWLRDANVNGLIGWSAANTWAGNLVVGGGGGWRLPTNSEPVPLNCNFAFVGTDCGYNVRTKAGDIVYSEMAHLFYVTLGNKAIVDTTGAAQAGSGLTNTANFQNLQAAAYWTGAPVVGGSFCCFTWTFSFEDGFQTNGSYNTNASSLFALAVRDGDVPAIPEPGSYALMLAGLTGLALRRRASTPR